MDAQTLSELMGGTLSLDRYRELLPGYEGAMRAAGVTTVNRSAMFAAQLGHESVGLRYMEEIADGSAYNGRADLGNVYAGDGPRFKGRGPIQLTGRNNYRAFTRWCRANGYSDIDFEANPGLLSEPKWGFLAAAYYWSNTRRDYGSGPKSLNDFADAGDIYNASRAVNGGTNGLQDRTNRWNKARAMGGRILPGGAATAASTPVVELLLEYSRNQVAQDTFYNCGPASSQTVILSATGRTVPELELGGRLGTDTGGTDWIGLFPAVLNSYIPGAQYRHADYPNYLSDAEKNELWSRITNSIKAGHGVIVNIVAPPSNYPRAVSPSTISPAYSGGTVYHYIAAMGYREDPARKVWIADSGFSPYGYWLSFDQLCSLLVPKGVAYSTAPAKFDPEEGILSALTPDEQREVLTLLRRNDERLARIYFELTHAFQSRIKDPVTGQLAAFRDTMIGFILEQDKKNEAMNETKLPRLESKVDALAASVSQLLQLLGVAKGLNPSGKHNLEDEV